MSKLTSLLKAITSDGFQIFNYRAQSERSRKMMPILLGLLVGVMMWTSASTLVTELKEDGLEASALSLYTLVTTAIIVMEGVYKSGDLLFRPRDNDTLLAMPIKKSTIVLARMIKFYSFELIYCLIFLLPVIIAYAMNVDVSVTFWLVAITVLVLVPAIPIAISCLVGLLISAASARFRHRTFLQVLISFVVLVAMSVLIFVFDTDSNAGEQLVTVINSGLAEAYYPAATFVGLVKQFDVWQYLCFVVVNITVIIATALIISRFYFQIVSRMSTVRRAGRTSSNYQFVQHSQTTAMVRKELNKYFTSSVLIMNTAIGLVLFLVAVVVLCFNYDNIVTSLMNSVEDFPLTAEEVYSYLPSIAFVLVTFASLMTFITANMISLEGKAFNLLKTMPISGVKVIMTKVLAAMILIVPVTLLGSIMMFFRFQFGILDAILVLIGVIEMPLVTEMVGILVNLKYARFDFESDTVAVKQSASVMVATFLGLFMVLLTFSLTLVAVFLAGQTVGLLMVDAVFVIVSLFLYFVVAMRGEDRYMKLTA